MIGQGLSCCVIIMWWCFAFKHFIRINPKTARSDASINLISRPHSDSLSAHLSGLDPI